MWDCNWKFAVDQFAEVYHLPALHPQLIEWWDTAGTPLDVYNEGKHSRQLIRQGYPGRAGPGRTTWRAATVTRTRR